MSVPVEQRRYYVALHEAFTRVPARLRSIATDADGLRAHPLWAGMARWKFMAAVVVGACTGTVASPLGILARARHYAGGWWQERQACASLGGRLAHWTVRPLELAGIYAIDALVRVAIDTPYIAWTLFTLPWRARP